MQVKSVQAKRKEITERVESLEQRVEGLVRIGLSPSPYYINTSS